MKSACSVALLAALASCQPTTLSSNSSQQVETTDQPAENPESDQSRHDPLASIDKAKPGDGKPSDAKSSIPPVPQLEK